MVECAVTYHISDCLMTFSHHRISSNQVIFLLSHSVSDARETGEEQKSPRPGFTWRWEGPDWTGDSGIPSWSTVQSIGAPGLPRSINAGDGGISSNGGGLIYIIFRHLKARYDHHRTNGHSKPSYEPTGSSITMPLYSISTSSTTEQSTPKPTANSPTTPTVTPSGSPTNVPTRSPTPITIATTEPEWVFQPLSPYNVPSILQTFHVMICMLNHREDPMQFEYANPWKWWWSQHAHRFIVIPFPIVPTTDFQTVAINVIWPLTDCPNRRRMAMRKRRRMKIST